MIIYKLQKYYQPLLPHQIILKSTLKSQCETNKKVDNSELFCLSCFVNFIVFVILLQYCVCCSLIYIVFVGQYSLLRLLLRTEYCACNFVMNMYTEFIMFRWASIILSNSTQ